MDLTLAYTTLTKMGRSFIASLPRLGAALIVVIIALILAHVFRWIVKRSMSHRVGHENLVLAVARLVYSAVLLIGVLIGATIAVPSFSVGNLISLLGVGGVVIGFAFNNIFQNFLAGILILVTNPFTVGDQIVVNNFEGTVDDIQTRATMIRTYDRRRVVVPNADLFTNAVIVNTAFPQRRVAYDLTMCNGVDVDKVRGIVRDAIRSGIEGVSKDPIADVLLTKTDKDGSTLRLLWWASSHQEDYIIVQDRVLTAIYEALHKAGVNLAAG